MLVWKLQGYLFILAYIIFMAIIVLPTEGVKRGNWEWRKTLSITSGRRMGLTKLRTTKLNY